jgi:hypothetical protein
MKRFLLLALLVSVAPIHAADPPSKRSGGLFGFGSQKTEQISAGLFPEAGYAVAPSDAVVTSSPAPAPTGGNEIFRSGQPQQVSAVSYVIQNGRKIEQPIVPAAEIVSPPAETPAPVTAAMTSGTESGAELANSEGRKKGGLFAFGRRNDEVEENEVVTPVPAAGGFAPPRAVPPMVAGAAPAPVMAVPAVPAAPAATPVIETADTPNFAGVKKEKEEKSGWIPFLSRKKNDSAPEMAPTAPAPAVIAAAEPTPAATPAPAPAANTPAQPAATTAATTAANSTADAPTTTFEVPRKETKKEEKKEIKPGSSGGGILSPIANIRVPRKDLDLSSAETIIQNGEIVAESESSIKTAPAPGPTGQRQAPQVVNGVKTYSSWNDVGAPSSSAADKIIGSLR